MRLISNFFIGVGLLFGLMLVGGYVATGPSFIANFLGAEMPEQGDGLVGSAIWLADYYWKFIIGALAILFVLIYAITPRSKRRSPAAPRK